jgi:hypothetical protein
MARETDGPGTKEGVGIVEIGVVENVEGAGAESQPRFIEPAGPKNFCWA